MNLRNLILATACALVSTAGAHAQSACHTYMMSGTYMLKIAGSATVATSPMPIFAPFVSLGLVQVDNNGAISSASPLNAVVGGAPQPPDSLKNSKLTLNADCTLTFVAACTNGCNWSGTGIFWRNGSAKEIYLMFTKADGYPLTAIAEMKSLSN